MKHAVSIVVIIALCLLPETLLAASLKGKLRLPGKSQSPTQYKVLALSKDGLAKVAPVSKKGSFSITAKKNATLHLIDSYNRYFGPLVAASSTKAFASLSGKSGSLGTADVKKGFAVVPYGKARNIFSAGSVSFHKSKGPRGAGKLGLVKKIGKQSLSSAADKDAGDIGDDPDSDGIPSAVDVDDDGDMILDVSDPSAGPDTDYNASITSTLRVAFGSSVNANAGGVTALDMDNALKNGLILGFRYASTKGSISSINIDCGSIPYCTSGTGSAVIRSNNLSSLEGTPWIGYDPDADGLPNVVVGNINEVGVKPKASSSDLRPGDTIYFKVKDSSGAVTVASVLPFYFMTGPALKEISSGGITQTITYPVSEMADGTSRDHPFQLNSGQVTFTLWRPQRPGVSGAESAQYIDMGKLSYGVHVADSETGSVLTCQSSDFIASPGGALVPAPGTPGAFTGIGKLIDTMDDAPADPLNTISYTLDLEACIARAGLSTAGRSVMLNIVAHTNRMDQTSQDVYFKLP